MAQKDIWRTKDDAAALEQQPSHETGRPLFEVVKISGVKPLEPKIGSEALDVPEALEAALFGLAPDPETSLHTYAVIDAAKVFGLQERLDSSGLPHRCLYTGESAQTYGDVAPWMVKLDRENAFTQALFQHSPDSPSPHHMWDANPGIFIRSAGDLDTLITHFRKFTKLADGEGKWFFFRFWESVTWDALVTLGGTDPKIVSRLLGSHSVLFKSVTSFADGTFFQVHGHG